MSLPRYGGNSLSDSSSSYSTLYEDEQPENTQLLEEYKDKAVFAEKPADGREDYENPFSCSLPTISIPRWSSWKAVHPRFEKPRQTPESRIENTVLLYLATTPKLEVINHARLASMRHLPFLIPNFVYLFSPASKTSKKLTHTAYLDGLRGCAAFCVMIHHYTCQFTPALLEGWGSGPDEDSRSQNLWFMQLPLIRVVHSGSFMVVLFFVISGCVLSARGLKLARAQKQSEFAKSMASSVFRRWLRLHLPVIASMCIAFVISRNQGWKHLSPDWLHPRGISSPAAVSTLVTEQSIGVGSTANLLANKTMVATDDNSSALAVTMIEHHSKPRLLWDWTGAKKNESLTWQIGDFAWAITDVCDPFKMGLLPTLQSSGYNAGMILWTIPSEWLGSIVVFFMTLGVAWTKTWLKLTILVCAVVWCHHISRWQLATFISGIFIAELTIIREASIAERSALPLEENEASPTVLHTMLPWTKRLFPWSQRTATIFWVMAFTVGCYIGAVPLINWDSSPGFVTLRSFVPDSYFLKALFYPCIGSLLVMLSITYCELIQRPFNTRIAQYLGRISFSLYLLHAQILISIGIPVFTGCMKFVGGGETQIGFTVGMLMGGFIMLFFTLWASDLFTRGVDEKCVAFARWVAERALTFP